MVNSWSNLERQLNLNTAVQQVRGQRYNIVLLRVQFPAAVVVQAASTDSRRLHQGIVRMYRSNRRKSRTSRLDVRLVMPVSKAVALSLSKLGFVSGPHAVWAVP